MQNNHRVEPHGGRLVELLVEPERMQLLKEVSINLPDITLNDRQLCDLELISTGAFSPLEGFMVRADYESVLDRMRLQKDVLWPIPACLDISETTAQAIETGQSAALRDAEGYLLAIIHVEDMWPVDKEKEAQAILSRMVSSFQLDPAWVAKQRNLTAEVSKVVSQTHEAISKIISDTYWHRQAVQDDLSRKWSNTILGQTDVVDPATGEKWKVASGHNYYWRKEHTDVVVGTDVYERPDIDFAPLAEW